MPAQWLVVLDAIIIIAFNIAFNICVEFVLTIHNRKSLDRLCALLSVSFLFKKIHKPTSQGWNVIWLNDIALLNKSSQSYEASLAIWDYTVLPSTRHKWAHPTLTPARHDDVYRVGMWRSQPISASVGCRFHVQNPSDADADLLCNQNYQLL